MGGSAFNRAPVAASASLPWADNVVPGWPSGSRPRTRAILRFVNRLCLAAAEETGEASETDRFGCDLDDRPHGPVKDGVGILARSGEDSDAPRCYSPDVASPGPPLTFALQ